MTPSTPVVGDARIAAGQTPPRLLDDGISPSLPATLLSVGSEAPLFNNALQRLPHELLEERLGAALAAQATTPPPPSLAAARSRARLARRLERTQQ